MPSLESNIRKLYTIKGLHWFLLMMPVLVLFFQENGLSMQQVLILQSLFAICVATLEVPSGYLSDRIGRKITMLTGLSFTFVGFLIYATSYSFGGFLFAELLLAVGGSLVSGTDSALIYDTLLHLNRQDTYKRVEGRYLAVANFSEATASIIGGFIALISLRTTLYVYAVFIFFTIPIAMRLVEPPRRIRQSGEVLPGMGAIWRYAMRENPQIKWLILYASVVASSTLTMVWFIQPYLRDAGLPLMLFGVVWAALNFSVGVFSLSADRVERGLGRRASLIGLVVLIGCAYWSVSVIQTLWGILFLFIFYFVRGVNEPILKDYVNRLIPSDRRATVLSIQNLMSRLFFAIAGPVVGWIADGYSFSTAFMVCGLAFTASGLSCLFFLHRHRAL